MFKMLKYLFIIIILFGVMGCSGLKGSAPPSSPVLDIKHQTDFYLLGADHHRLCDGRRGCIGVALEGDLKSTRILSDCGGSIPTTLIPAPDPDKKQTLLIIPVSFECYPKHLDNTDRFGINFERENDKKQQKFTFGVRSYFLQDFIVIDDMETGLYFINSYYFYTHDGVREHEFSEYFESAETGDGKIKPREEIRKRHASSWFLENLKTRNLKFKNQKLKLEMKDKHVNTLNYKIVLWEYLGKSGGCCDFQFYLKNTNDSSRNDLIAKLKKIENFEKWELQ